MLTSWFDEPKTFEQRRAPSPMDEEAEVRELQQLLARTIHSTTRHRVGIACSGHATAGLRMLPDGQSDDIATLHKRRAREDAAAAETTNRPTWDSTTYKYMPAALKGMRPVTPEPWARDSKIYMRGAVEGHGAQRHQKSPPRFPSPDERPGGSPPHVHMIEKDRYMFRQELGTQGPGAPILSARTPRSARGTPRSAREWLEQQADDARARNPPAVDLEIQPDSSDPLPDKARRCVCRPSALGGSRANAPRPSAGTRSLTTRLVSPAALPPPTPPTPHHLSAPQAGGTGAPLQGIAYRGRLRSTRDCPKQRRQRLAGPGG
jgi:hypothetical protein